MTWKTGSANQGDLMLNFPVPYPDELLYSTVARAGVHFGITSPKQLLDEVFGDRKVVATADLPSHIEAIADKYPASLGLTPEKLVYGHTLFPLYAPFIPESRRLQVLEAMKLRAKGAVHLALGVTTSLVRRSKHFRICPECLEEQLSNYGELYWARQWQVTGCRCCLKHAELCDTQHTLRHYHRHAFIPLVPFVFCLPRTNSPPYDKRIERRVREILDHPPVQSPSLEQWSLFYQQAARAAGITRKSKVIFEDLKHKVLSRWPSQQLAELGIPITDSSSNWLRLIVRKHRKSFSYVQHIVLLEALLEAGWRFEEVLWQTKEQVFTESCRYSPSKGAPQATLLSKREEWLEMVREMGTRNARLAGGDAIYTWLYRNDRSWLKQLSEKYRKTTRSENQRVNWAERDRQVRERLERVKQAHAGRLDLPRKSKNWYCAQANCRHLMRKLNKLPLSAAFLEENSEDVANYQIRRIIRVLQTQKTPAKIQYWELLRLSGLSEERMKRQTRLFLRNLGWPE